MTPEEAYRAGYQAGKLSMPEIVRCKDCRKNMMCEITIGKSRDWYCADGERKCNWFCADGGKDDKVKEGR